MKDVEIWKVIPNTNNEYEISNRKQVRKGSYELTQLRNKSGGFSVMLRLNGQVTSKTVNALYHDGFKRVLNDDEYFKPIPNCDGYEISNYKNVRSLTAILNSGRKRNGKILIVTSGVYVCIDGTKCLIQELYDMTFENITTGNKPVIKKKKSIKKKSKIDNGIEIIIPTKKKAGMLVIGSSYAKPIQSSNFISNSVNEKIKEFKAMKAANPERYN